MAYAKIEWRQLLKLGEFRSMYWTSHGQHFVLRNAVVRVNTICKDTCNIKRCICIKDDRLCLRFGMSEPRMLTEVTYDPNVHNAIIYGMATLRLCWKYIRNDRRSVAAVHRCSPLTIRSSLYANAMKSGWVQEKDEDIWHRRHSTTATLRVSDRCIHTSNHWKLPPLLPLLQIWLPKTLDF